MDIFDQLFQDVVFRIGIGRTAHSNSLEVLRGFNEGHIITKEPLLWQLLYTVDQCRDENI